MLSYRLRQTRPAPAPCGMDSKDWSRLKHPERWPITAMDGTWLELCCCGGRTVMLPVRMILARHRRPGRLRDVLGRLKCRLCGHGPQRVQLCERGDLHGWAVVVHPRPDR